MGTGVSASLVWILLVQVVVRDTLNVIFGPTAMVIQLALLVSRIAFSSIRG